MTVSRLLSVCVLLLSLGCGSNKPESPTTPTPTPNVPTPQANRAPSITSMTVSPTFAVSALTTVTMIGAATDADGDPLTYTWSFNGANAGGASTSAKLTGDGSVPVQLTVTDGRGGTITDTRTVTVGTVTGSWDFVAGVCATDPREKPAVFTLTQTNGVVTGSLSFPGNWFNVSPGAHGEIPASTPGTIDDQGNFSLPRVAVGAFLDIRLTGKMDATGRKITGAIFNSGFTGEPFLMTKK